jgi:hypothetical protein
MTNSIDSGVSVKIDSFGVSSIAKKSYCIWTMQSAKKEFPIGIKLRQTTC